MLTLGLRYKKEREQRERERLAARRELARLVIPNLIIAGGPGFNIAGSGSAELAELSRFLNSADKDFAARRSHSVSERSRRSVNPGGAGGAASRRTQSTKGTKNLPRSWKFDGRASSSAVPQKSRALSTNTAQKGTEKEPEDDQEEDDQPGTSGLKEDDKTAKTTFIAPSSADNTPRRTLKKKKRELKKCKSSGDVLEAAKIAENAEEVKKKRSLFQKLRYLGRKQSFN